MMAKAKPDPGFTGNLFLDSLPSMSAECLLPLVEHFPGSLGTPVAHVDLPIQHVVFPVAAVVSAVTRMQDGTDIEVLLVGREGFFGIPLVLGNDTGGNEAMVQIAGSAWRISSVDFVKRLRADPALNRQALSYTQVAFDTISQFSGCNRLHPINERCARWLLMAHDRIVGDTIFLTHDYLATMLGVGRPSVSIAAAALDEAGYIEYQRGRIRMKNRRGLESAACECYAVANDIMERLLGYNVRKRDSSDGRRGAQGSTVGSKAD